MNRFNHIRYPEVRVCYSGAYGNNIALIAHVVKQLTFNNYNHCIKEFKEEAGKCSSFDSLVVECHHWVRLFQKSYPNQIH